MAEERIQMHFGGVYTAGDMWDEATGDVKRFQAAHKDMAQAAKSSLGQIAGMFDGELKGSVQSAYTVLKQVANGGIWGVMSAAVTQTISHFKKLREESEALQKRMQDMRAGMVALMEEQAAAMEAAAKARLESIAARANDAVAAVDRLAASMRAVAAAEDAAIGAAGQLKIAQITDEFSKKLSEAADELKPLIMAERTLAVAVEQQNTARAEQTRAIEREKVKLAEIEEQIQLQKEAIEAETAAGHDTAEAYRKLTELNTARSAQVLRLQNAETAAETAALHHETAVRDATAALEAAKAAWDNTVAASERAAEAAEEKAGLDNIHTQITRICMKNEVDAAAYIKLYGESIAKGLTHAEAYAELQKKLNDELEKRVSAEKKTNSGKGSGRGGASASAIVHLDPDEIASGVEETPKMGAMKQVQEDAKNTAAEQKKLQSAMNQDAIPLFDFLKGRMKPELADAFAKKLAETYKPDQIKTMASKALEAQLNNTREAKEQTKKLQKIVAAAEKMHLK